MASISNLAFYILGLADAQADFDRITIPLLLKPQIQALLREEVLQLCDRPDGDPFKHRGVWHLAVASLCRRLDREVLRQTENAVYDYPHGLVVGDSLFRALMRAVILHGLELPSSEDLAQADANREAQAERDLAENIRLHKLASMPSIEEPDQDWMPSHYQ